MSKVAFITGAAQGIGKGIAVRLAQDGFDVGINDLPSNSANLDSVRKEIEALGKKAVIVLGDVSEELVVEDMVRTVVEKLGGLDVMVANAGIGPLGLIQDTSAAQWDHVMAINARGVFLCYKYAAKQMILQGKERGGRIIGASSWYGKRGAPNAAPYCAAKFAVRGLTQAAAAEYGQYGITVNAYAPGYIDTPMTRTAGVAEGVLKEGEFLEGGIKLSLLGQHGTPADIASWVSYLSRQESRFMTGQTVCIDGGLFFD